MPIVLITRPEPEASATAARVAALGHVPLVDPMLAIRPVEGPPLDLAGMQALVCTSVNGVRALAARTAERTPTLYAVGTRTADEARTAGFADVIDADGDLEALAALLARRVDPARGALLHAAGAETAGDLAVALAPRGITVRREVLYEAVPADALRPETVRALGMGGLSFVLLFSPRTARTFARLTGLIRPEGCLSAVTALCLSDRVAEAAGAGWAGVRVARRPDQESLLDLLPR